MDDARIAGIYLAAGKALRMGKNKLNLPYGDHYLGSVAFSEALQSMLDITIAVTRKGDSLIWLAPFAKNSKWCQLECIGVDVGISESIKTGVRYAIEIEADGLIVLLADQPLVTRDMINCLVKEFLHTSNIPFLSFSHKGILKPPVLFARKMFPRLLELEGDKGARALIRTGLGKKIEIENDICFFDVDTMEDYNKLRELTSKVKEAQTKNASI